MSTPPSCIAVMVPVSKVYLESYRAFWQRLGCRVEAVDQSTYCRIVFPPGTIRGRRVQSTEPRFLLRLPDQTMVEEVQSRNCSFLYAELN